MRNLKLMLFMVVIAVAAAACADAATPEPTATEGPTQTPFVLVVTATDLPPTPVPSATPIPPTQQPEPTRDPLLDCTVQAGWPVYEVVSGDTLSSIAVRANSTVNMLQRGNCLGTSTLIRVGQELHVPQLPAPEEDDLVVEDLITEFSLDVTETDPGATVTLSWEAEEGTVVEISHQTGGDAVLGSNLAASGSLTYTVPSADALGDLTQLEFVIKGTKSGDDGEITASPLSILLDVSVEAPEATEEVTDEPVVTEEATEEMTEEPQATEEVTAEATEEV